MCKTCSTYLPSVVASPEKHDILSTFYIIETCKAKRILYTCKSCGLVIINLIRAYIIMDHIRKNTWNKSTCVHSDMYRENLLLDINGYSLDFFYIIKALPQLCCLKIDYKNALSKFISENNEEILKNTKAINSVLDNFRDVIQIISRQPAYCALCGNLFETFPSIEVVNSHSCFVARG